jgi:hypothetical protein
VPLIDERRVLEKERFDDLRRELESLLQFQSLLLPIFQRTLILKH